ncbi:hypothetical protein Acr_02g0009090 [Actinidia rufa]|uniref:Uncharacterized protein n=1 Tax=Actinidia rufa TaxID=165716 RepID=A0A7J0E9S8_9ERIC|nr:hypothetical protein Acr_02g0009090 [Actinidia rufa]
MRCTLTNLQRPSTKQTQIPETSIQVRFKVRVGLDKLRLALPDLRSRPIKVDLTPTGFPVARRTSNRLRHRSMTFDSPRRTSDRLRRGLPDLREASPSLAGPPIIFVITRFVWHT